MTTIEELYKEFGVLHEAKDNASKHVESYKRILQAAEGGASEKRLASQFAARFFKYFPELAEETINALLDICEDNDVLTRRQAIKDLPAIAKVKTELVPRLSDILAQLLHTDDSGELVSLQQSLLQVFAIDQKGALDGIFHQVLEGDEVVRTQVIKFLVNKQKTIPADQWTKETEEYLLEKCKKVLDEVSGEQFVQLLTMLNRCTHLQSLQGRQQLLELITEQADLDKPFDAADPDALNRFIVCTRLAQQLCSRNVHSTRFVQYLCTQVLGSLGEVLQEENSEELQLYRLLAELTPFMGAVDPPEDVQVPLHQRLLTFMPLPPSEEQDGKESATNGKADPELHFSQVECLLFAAHDIGRKYPKFYTDETDAERMKDFRKRLQFFARGNQAYLRSLKADLAGKKPDELKSDENKVKLAALKVTGNISVLIKDLFHNPPLFKNTIALSWKPKAEAAGLKRSASTDIDNKVKGPKMDQERYAPPSGKFSNRAGAPPTGARGGFRGARGGGYRGGYRRSWRGNRGRYSY